MFGELFLGDAERLLCLRRQSLVLQVVDQVPAQRLLPHRLAVAMGRLVRLLRQAKLILQILPLRQERHSVHLMKYPIL